MTAPIPDQDAARLDVLRQYSILDTPPEEEYDALARLAAFVAGTPLALIALVDRERVWFKARVGTDTPESRRAWAFSSYVVDQHQPLIVEDARHDPRFVMHPRVAGPPGLRFYAGFPLVTREGYVVGSLNVQDYKPRQLTAEQMAALRSIAGQVMHLLELRRARLEINETLADLQLAHAQRSVTEQKFATVFQLGPDALLLTRLTDSHILHVNRRFTEITGYPTEEAVGRTTLDLGLWVNPQERQQYAAELMKTGRVHTRDTQFRTKAGQVRFGEGSAELIDVAGEKCLLVVMRDITERRQAEEALRRSESRFSKVFHSCPSPVGMGTMDEGRFIDLNERYAEFFGYTREEMLGRSVEELGLWADYSDRVKVIERLRTTGAVHGVESRFRHRSGEIRHALLYMERLELEDQPLLVAMLADVTERRKAEQALRQSEDRYRRLAEVSPLAVFETDAQGRCTFLNPRWSEVFGCPIGEGLEFGWIDKIHPDDAALVREDWARKAGNVDRQEYEYRILRPDGNVRWVRGIGQAVRSPQGEIRGYVGVVEDVTARKQAEAERERLLESERRQRLEAETLRDVTLALTSRLTLDDVLDEILTQARRLVPCDAANLRLVEGDIIHVARAQGYENHGSGIDDLKMNVADFPLNKVVLRQRIPVIVEDTQQEKDWVPLESTRWIRSHLTLPICVQEHVVGMLKLASARPGHFHAPHAELLAPLVNGAAVAIEQALLTDMLRESEAKFRALTESVASAIFISRGDRILYANREAERLLDYTRQQLLAMPSWQVIHPDDVEMVHRRRDARLRGEEAPSRYEFRFVDRHGRARWVDFTATVTDYEGAPAVLGTAFDITERKLLEEQLRQAQKMEAVGRLAGGVAHDFNNLLNVILGYCELLRDEMSGEDPRLTQLDQIARAGDRAASLTRQLLAFSRQQVLQPQVVNLNDVLVNMEKMVQRLIGEDVVVRTRFDAELGRTRVDPGQIEQVVMNLAVNARDAMPTGGSFVLETDNVTLTEADCRALTDVSPGAYIRLQITDTGAGMTAETLARCFEPFFTTKEVGKGTGLGLSMVYGIVKQSGGHIIASSTLGQGATFRVFFPRVDEPAGVPSVAILTGAPAGTETILLVEDDPAVRRLACDYLTAKGYSVLEASNPARALEIAREHPGQVDLVLTDVIMPGTSGPELVESLRQVRPGLRVLYMSGYTADAIAHHGVLDAGVEFIQKPFTPSALARRLRETLDA